MLLFALGLGFLYVTRATLIAFLFAIFFAYLMSPIVNRLEKVLRGRGRAIAVIYVLLIALVVVFFLSVGPKVTREGAPAGSVIADFTHPTEFRRNRPSDSAAEHGWSKTSTEHRSVVSGQPQR